MFLNGCCCYFSIYWMSCWILDQYLCKNCRLILIFDFHSKWQEYETSKVGDKSDPGVQMGKSIYFHFSVSHLCSLKIIALFFSISLQFKSSWQFSSPLIRIFVKIYMFALLFYELCAMRYLKVIYKIVCNFP